MPSPRPRPSEIAQAGELWERILACCPPEHRPILNLKRQGFSLDEIGLMFAPDGRLRIDRRMLAAKAEELDRTIRKLTEMRDGLRHAAACRAPSHMECPTFRRILRAASGAIGVRRTGRTVSLTDRALRGGRGDQVKLPIHGATARD